MKIYYQPPTYPLDPRGQEEFYRKYVVPLGRGRKNVKISTDNAIIEGNAPGLLGLSANLLAISLTDSIHFWRLEPVEELNPPGGWYGDLEPNSPTLMIQKIGSPMHSSNSFQYEAPPFRIDHRPVLDKNSIMELTLGQYEGHQEMVVRGNASALVSLAKHAIYFSQAPVGASVVFGKREGIKDERYRLVFKRILFSEDVPWAKIPVTKRTGEQGLSSEKPSL